MTDNEIIKALEHCSDNKSCIGSKCPVYNYSANCTVDLMKETLDLITRQQAEIKALKKVVLEDYATEYDDKIKSEAVKEFSKSLIDKTRGGKISSIDILDFAVDYLRSENNGNV